MAELCRFNILTGVRRAIILGLSTFFTVILATGMRGDWLFIYVQAKRLWQGDTTWRLNVSDYPSGGSIDIDNGMVHDFLRRHYMKDLWFYILQSVTGGFLIFYGVGGYLKWYYYIQRRERAADWKCQPDRFLEPEDGKLEFWLGSFNMVMSSIISGCLVAYVMNGGETTLYYNIKDYGWVYFVCSIPLTYLYNEGSLYYIHRASHHSFIYSHFHKVHHRFKAPTPWAATAVHPVEFLTFQFFLEIPIFLVPVHAGVFLFWLVYGLYYGIIGHSGIDLHSMWPWQPSTMYHDDHHKYFHCNFGVNSWIFDKFHGTFRRSDRFYSETIFGGKGASISDDSTANDKDKYS